MTKFTGLFSNVVVGRLDVVGPPVAQLVHIG